MNKNQRKNSQNSFNLLFCIIWFVGGYIFVFIPECLMIGMGIMCFTVIIAIGTLIFKYINKKKKVKE